MRLSGRSDRFGNIKLLSICPEKVLHRFVMSEPQKNIIHIPEEKAAQRKAMRKNDKEGLGGNGDCRIADEWISIHPTY